MKSKAIRILRTAIQSAIGAGIVAIVPILSASNDLGGVNWISAFSTAGLTILVAFLMNVKAALPENDTQISLAEEVDDEV